jgi:hypothetical protein
MISSPDMAASRSSIADWLELRAVLNSHGAGAPDIASLARFASDDHRIRTRDEADDITEEEIADSTLETLIDRVSEEIDFRATCLGPEYAFDVLRPFNITLKPECKLTDPHWAYLFLLILSVENSRSLPQSQDLSQLIRTGRTLFHACASVGVAGLIRNAETVWFGWPRPDATAFPQALDSLCRQLGWGRPKDPPPPGFSAHTKDDGIDIVGWRRFRDRKNGTMLVLCQAATGNNWDEKSIVTHVEAFTDWFDLSPYGRATSSIAVPFPAHHEVTEFPEAGFELARHNYLNRQQKKHGVLIDRLRIVESIHDIALATTEKNVVGGIDKIPELKKWVEDALAAIRKVAQ